MRRHSQNLTRKTARLSALGPKKDNSAYAALDRNVRQVSLIVPTSMTQSAGNFRDSLDQLRGTPTEQLPTTEDEDRLGVSRFETDFQVQLQMANR